MRTITHQVSVYDDPEILVIENGADLTFRAERIYQALSGKVAPVLGLIKIIQ